MQAHISRIIPWERSVRTPLFAFSSQPSMEICSGWNNVMTLNLLIGTTLRNIPNQQGYFSVNPIFYYGHNSSAANALYIPSTLFQQVVFWRSISRSGRSGGAGAGKAFYISRGASVVCFSVVFLTYIMVFQTWRSV